MPTRTTLLAAALLVLHGCAGCETVPAGAVQQCEATLVLPGAVATDILFVVDDSGSMIEEQTNLRNNLGVFIDGLAASPIQNDFRIGVTTTSVEEFNATATTGHAYGLAPSLGVPYPAGALIAIKQDRNGNGIAGAFTYDAVAYAATAGWGGARILDQASPTLARDFKANVMVGTIGSGKEQHFRAARLALSDRLLDANKSFLRPGARLAVIFVTDEDDCSDTAAPFAGSNAACHDMAVKDASPPILDPVGEFASFLLGPVDGELREVAVGSIAGFAASAATGGFVPSCGDAALCANTACSTAYDKGDRFAQLRDQVGGARMRLGSICDPSFAATLSGFAEILMPSSMPLQGAPADWRMLVVSVARAGGGADPCTLAEESTPAQASADAVYSPPRFGQPAMLSFQNRCALSLGDRIDVRVVCAG